MRDKIERRYANAMGAAELAQNSVQGRMMEVQQASVEMAGHSRLEQIRASMRGEALPSGGCPAPPTPAARRDGRADAREADRPVAGRWRSHEAGSTASSTPEAWRSMLQRGIDTAAELSDVVAQKLNAAADPAGQAAAQAQVGTAADAVLRGVVPDLGRSDGGAGDMEHTGVGLFIPAPIAVGAAFLATLSFLRYRWLRGEPLPPQRSRAARRLPPFGSAARQPMAALAASERGLFSLLGVMERGRMLPADELRELIAAANQTAATMAATADEVVSMERAVAKLAAVARASGADDRRVHRAARQGCPPVQRHGHRGSAIGVSRQHRPDVEFADVAAALPRRTGQRHRPADWAGRRRSTNWATLKRA